MKKLLRNLSVLCFVFAAFLATGCYEEELPFLTVDHEVVLVGPSMDKGTVLVESNLEWFASSDVEWITIDNGFGNHKGTFEFFVDANTSPNERSGKIILKDKDEVVSVTILVRQQSEGSILTLSADEISFTKDAGDYLMSVACNGEWKVASSADWCTVDPAQGEGNGSFKVTVAENNTGADRVATLTILTEADGKTEVRKVLVYQSASNAALVVSPESKELTSAASNFTLDVITTGNWEASLDSDWLTLSESEGSGDTQITVSATANDTGAPRVAIITFASGAENENRVIRQIVVKQAAVDFYLYVPVTDYPLSLEEQTIEIPYELEGSNVTVTASSSSKWMTVESVADGIATVKVAENTTAIAREGVISFITHGQEGEPIIRQVRVAQAPTINLLDVLADEYAVEWTGETFRIPIYSNTPVSVRSSESWCTAVAEGQEIVITVPENKTAYPRVAVVTVSTDSEKGETITRTTIVRQAAAYSELVVTPATKSIYATAQSFVATIVTNNSWTAQSDSDWLTIDKAAGEGDYMLTVSAAKNESGQVRVATITVQTGAENSKRESATIVVTQRPEQFYFDVPVRSYLFGKDGGLAKVPFVTSGNEQSVTAASNVDWLQVGDIEDGFVKVNVWENKTAEVRTGTVTITCTPVFGDPIAIPVTFTQSPTINILDVFVSVIDASARGDEFALPYYANTPVSVSSSEDWIHAEVTVDEDSYDAECCSYSDPQKIIKIEVDPNRTGEARVGYVTIATVNEAGEKITKVITIRQAALYAALSVTPKTVVIPAHEGHFNVVINTTGTWAASTTCTWLDSEDDWAGFGDYEMFFWAGDNTTGAQREGDIIIATGPENNEREEQVVHVIQLERSTYIEIPISAYAISKDAHTVATQNALEVGYYAAGDFKGMQVNCSEDWITYNASASDRETLVFDVLENDTAEPRTATVTVTLDLFVGEPITDTFIVTQAPTVNILDVYVDFYEASPKGETVVFPLYGNTEIGASVSAQISGWCEILYGTPNQEVDPQEIVIGIKKNESAEARIAYVTLTTVTDKGEKLTHIITIHQNPLNATLIVSPEKVVIPAHDATFWTQIVTTGTWELDWAQTWIDPEEYTGEGDETVEWTAEDNETGLQRETTIIVFTGDENETRVEKTVQVIQLAADTYLDIPMDNFILSKEKQKFHVAIFAAGDITNSDFDYNADWLNVYEFNLEQNLLGVEVQENTTAEPRTATVTVTIERAGGEPYTDSFTVTQAGTYNVLEGLSDMVSVDPAGDTITLPVITNVESLRAVVSEQWLTANVEVDEDYDIATVGFKAEANTTGKDRHASVTLITETQKGQTLEKKIMVFQAAASTHFAILSGERVLVPKAGSSEDGLSVIAYASVNADKVQMISAAPWITVKTEPTVDAENKTIVEGVFTVAPNNTGERRSGEIVVTFFDEHGDTVQKTVVVEQSNVDGGALSALVDFIVVSAAGEELDLSFDADETLTATPSASWLQGTAIQAPVTDPQVLHIKAAANETGLDRTSYITVSNGSESVVITVFQPAANTQFAILSSEVIYIDKTERTMDLEAYASVNADQVVANSDQSWLQRTNGQANENVYTATFHVDPNTEGDARTANVKFTFTDDKGDVFVKSVTIIQASGDNVLEAMTDYVALDPKGETFKVGFISDPELTAAISSSTWLSANYDVDGVFVVLKAGANNTGRDRTAYVTVKNSKLTKKIEVFQAANGVEFRVLDPTVAASSADQYFNVAAYGSTGVTADNISAAETEEWITVAAPDVTSDPIASFKVKLAENTTGATREGVIRIDWVDDANVLHSGTVTITQSPSENILDVYESNLLLPYLADEILLPVYSNTKSIKARSSSTTWLGAAIQTNTNEEDPSAKETTDVKLTIKENETGEPRIGFVTVTAEFDDGTTAEKVIRVLQLPKNEGGEGTPTPAEADPYLILGVEDVTLPAEASSKTVNVFTNAVSYTVNESADWLTATKGSVILDATENTGDERTTNVTVTATFADGSTMTKTLVVTQLAPAAVAPTVENYLELGTEDVKFPADAAEAEFNVFTNATDYTVESSAAWLTATKGSVKLAATANQGTQERTATVTVTGTFESGNPISKTMTVTQAAPVVDPVVNYFYIPEELFVPYTAGVNEDPYWAAPGNIIICDVSPNSSWITAAQAVDGKVKVTVAENENTSAREGLVTVTATFTDGTPGTIIANVTIKQQAKPEPTQAPGYLECNLGCVEEEYQAVTVDVPFDTDAVSYEVTKDADWISISNQSPVSNEHASFKVVLPQYDQEKTRVGVVTVTATFGDSSTKKYYLPVIQHPASRYFVALNDHYDLDFSGTGTLYLPYTANPTPPASSTLNVVINAKTSQGNDWLEKQSNSGSNRFITNHSLVFKITRENGSYINNRTGTITITWTDPEDPSHTSTYVVTVVQPHQ